MEQRWPEQFPLIWQVLPALLSPQDLVWLALDNTTQEICYAFPEAAIDCLTMTVFPFLNDSDLLPIKDLICPHLDPSAWSTDHQRRPSPAFELAARLGMHDEVLAVVQSWPDDLYN
jgi:hypothetical protein